MIPGVLGAGERSFLLGALLHRELEPARLGALAAGGLDWPALLAAAARVGLLPAVGSAVGAASLGQRVPAPLREALERAVAQNIAHNVSMLGALARAVRLLAAEGIEAIPIKGMGLLITDPGLIPLRTVVDIDLLLRPADLARSEGLLLSSGWRPLPSPLVVDEAGRPVDPGAAAREAQHGVPLADADGHVVELHVALPAAHGRPREAGEPFFARAVPRRWRGQVISCPSPDDALAVACEHVLLHHPDDPVHLPRLLLDLQALLAVGAEPARARALLGDGAETVVDEALSLLEEARQGAASATSTGRGRLERSFSPLWATEVAWRQRLRALGRQPARLRALLREQGVRGLFPSRQYMAARYGVRPDSPTLPLYYAWRPVRKLIGLLTGR